MVNDDGLRCEHVRIVTRALLYAKTGRADFPEFLVLLELANGGCVSLDLLTAARVADLLTDLSPTDGYALHALPWERSALLEALGDRTVH